MDDVGKFEGVDLVDGVELGCKVSEPTSVGTGEVIGDNEAAGIEELGTGNGGAD